MTPVDLLLARFLLASACSLAAGLAVWALTRLLRRLPGFEVQRSAWLLAQISIAATFLVVALPHSERLRLVPPIELATPAIGNAPAGASGLPAAAPLEPGQASASASLPSMLAWAARAWMAIYLLGLACCLLRLLQAQRLLAALAAAGKPAGIMDQHPGLGVIEVDAPISPMLFGLVRPRLLLPRHLGNFDTVARQMIVEHELTHLQRRDLHWMSAALLLETLLWFNPFMRQLRTGLTWAQELGCDRDVLAGRSQQQRKAYAAALVAQLAVQHRRLPTALAFGGVSPGSVASRIALIRTPPRHARGTWARLGAAGSLVAVLAASLALQPVIASRADQASGAAAAADLSCTLLVDAVSGARLVHEGQCDARVTPASTFNIAVSLMGYDSGILLDRHAPALPFEEGFPDWNPAWRATTDPTSWLANSVLWYAQQLTARLGAERFGHYVRAFNYGNQDVSGDAGKNNGLTMSWVNSSLAISATEQVNFLRGLVNRRLGVSDHAYAMTASIMQSQQLDGGWTVHGKTGTGNPVRPDGKDDETRQYGWYVGWATKGERRVVFARLILEARDPNGAAGPRLKQAFLRDLPASLDGS